MTVVPLPGRDPGAQKKIAEEIAEAATSLCKTAHDAGFDVLARLLNLVRIEAELKADRLMREPKERNGSAPPRPC
jgi:hypothetical protein